jgi:tetratricopeptide (TPR) repeat protein
MSALFSYLQGDDCIQAIELARHIARRDWVLFAGGGISRPSGLPLWRDLVNLMKQRLGPEADSPDPLEVASLFEANLGRNALVSFLRESLATLGLSSNVLHNRLLDLRPHVIVTTNFDDLLERALDQRRLPHALVITDQDLALVGSDTLVIKPHGDLKSHDSLVFTRRDYARYPRQAEVNNKLRTLIAQHAFFFVGYSLNDHDLERQFEKLLDAQGELARHHYLVVDKVTHLHRSAFLKRNIHIIELGSYAQLEQFLLDLSAESERHRAPPTTHLTSVAEGPETLRLDTAEETILALLEVDYAPVSEALQQLRLADAETHLQPILDKLQQVQETGQALAHRPGFKDFHQRVFLALATIAVRRRHNEEARTFYQRAKELQSFAGRRRLQAAEILISLGALQEVDALLVDSAEAKESRGKELLGLAALLRGDQAQFYTLYPTAEDKPCVEFAIQQARLAVESAQDATAQGASHLLDKAWQLSQDFPPGLLVITSLTDSLLRRIIIEEWEVHGIERRELLRTIRTRYQQVLTIFESLADQYQEGLVAILSQLLAFHSFVDETETQQHILARLQSLPGVTRERVLAEHFAGATRTSLDVLEDLFQKGALSFGQKALLMGEALGRDGKSFEAEQVYRQALSQPVPLEERPALLASLLELILKEERYEEALAYLEESTEPGEAFRELMRGMVFLSRTDRESALRSFQKGLEQHPRNIFLLQKLLHLLSKPQEDNGLEREALHYAESLEALLPSFESTLSRVIFLARLGRYTEALQLVEEVEGEGYVTLRVLTLKADLLEELGKNRDAAALLTDYRDRYSDYLFRSREAAAWAKAGDIERAIPIWEELRHRLEADGDLYRNLAIAYIQRGALNPHAFGQAFDIVKDALEKFPERKEFAALLVQAGEGCGRSQEAWEIIAQRPDLLEGPYLRTVSLEQTLEIVKHETQAVHTLEEVYRSGVIPFTTYAHRSPRSPLFLWQVRTHLWRKKHRVTPLFCSFPHVSLTPRCPRPSEVGVVLDMTALLTLGSLNVTHEILEAFSHTDKSIFLFPGIRQWLEEEVARLSWDQMPAYRERHKWLQERLRSARERVDLVVDFADREPSLDESLRQRLGTFAWDVEIAIDRGCVCVSDDVPREVREELSATVITSSEFLAALEGTGVLLPEDTERVRTEYPNIFTAPSTNRIVSLERPVMFSMSTLQMWFDSGLLERWLQDQSGWPPKIIVGPDAWFQLSRDVTEDEIYREALQLASDLRAFVVEALDGSHVEELSISDPPDLGIHPDLRGPLTPALALLAEARARQLALWTDDLCSHLLVDYRGSLSQDPAVVDTVVRVRQAFSDVSVVGTEDILYWLESVGYLPRERRLRLVWDLHRDGYRFLNVGEVLLWLLKRYRYDCKAEPVARLLHDLETASSLSLPHVDAERLRFFIGIYIGGVLSRTIADLWHLEDTTLTGEMKKRLSTELTKLFERTALQ